MSPSKLFLPLLFLFVSIYAKAQFTNYGSDPASFKWSVARTLHYKLIYPQGNDTLAYRYATLLETVYPHLGKTIGASHRKTFPVILHPANMRSNGMVTWTPRRMELIITPPSDMYAQSWDKQLAIHESRHVFQMNKIMRRGFNALYYIIGEQAAGIASLPVPKWFFEGDAVTAETALSNSGRGRLPEFNMAYRAQSISGKAYPFDKWFLGSYKDYTGNYYALGYDLTAYARYRYGADIWDKVTDRYTRYILHIPPFANAMKHYAGVNATALFQQTFSFLKQDWEKKDSIYTTTDNTYKPVYLSPETKQYTSYEYPQVLNDSTVISFKSSLYDIHSLVVLKNGKEERLTHIGTINSRIILNNNRIYWTEYLPGLRWAHKNYSVVKYYDLTTKRIITLTPRGRYLSPSVDADGKTIAVSRFSESGMNQILLIDVNTGKETACYDVPNNAFAKETAYGETNKIIAFAVNNNDGIGILQLDTETKEWKKLLSPTYANITSPSLYDGKLLFESGLNGTNNIYSLDTRTLRSQRLTSARFGAFSPTLSAEGKLIYSDYQAKGYRIASVVINRSMTDSADFSSPYRFPLAEAIKEQEQFCLDTATLSLIHFNPQPYRRISHLFRIHSWSPFFYNITDVLNVQTDNLTTIVKPGAMILSQNMLNTAIAQAGWYYQEGYHHGELSFTYMGWYPVVSMNIDYGGKAFEIAWEREIEKNEEILQGHYTNNHLIEAETQIYIPFNLSRNHYISRFQPIITYSYTNNKYQQHSNRTFYNFQYLLSELRYYRYRQLAQRDILPQWGYQIRLQHLRSPFDTKNFGSLSAIQLTGYLPGLVRNNGWILRFGYQYQNVDNKSLYLPTQLLSAPRGYYYNYVTRQQWTFKADYSFGISCPDFSIGSLAYIKRIRSNVFYDYSYNQAHKKANWTAQSSSGFDFIFDWNAIRADFPLSSGIRIIKPLQDVGLRMEALFSITF
ncbi:Protein TolB [termite gut metagenome]|uniref:Protein TolB n=1 Tax=termite gut metagenome TaxID=433724 RepID=A0A5J4RBW9_9ZZZZ